MSHQKFEKKGLLLGHLIEECGEVLAAAGKTIRFGWYSYNPLPESNSETNEEWLRREIVDLEKVIERLRQAREWPK